MYLLKRHQYSQLYDIKMSNYVKTMFPQASISTRSDTAVSKPAVFHSETKRRLQLEVQTKRKNGNFLKGQRKNVSILPS